MTLRPFSSVSDSCASTLLSAAATAASTSSWVCVLSTTISRGVCNTPILTSTGPPAVTDGASPSTLAEAATPRRSGRCAGSETRSGIVGVGLVGVLGAGEVRDAPPQQRFEQEHGVLVRHRPVVVEPPSRGHLRP